MLTPLGNFVPFKNLNKLKSVNINKVVSKIYNFKPVYDGIFIKLKIVFLFNFMFLFSKQCSTTGVTKTVCAIFSAKWCI